LPHTPKQLTVLVAFTLLSIHTAWAQATPPSGQQAQDGMANAGPHEAEFDAQRRPITAGGFVKTGPIVFMDTAKAAGHPSC